jgi:hypothetical protein
MPEGVPSGTSQTRRQHATTTSTHTPPGQSHPPRPAAPQQHAPRRRNRVRSRPQLAGSAGRHSHTMPLPLPAAPPPGPVAVALAQRRARFPPTGPTAEYRLRAGHRYAGVASFLATPTCFHAQPSHSRAVVVPPPAHSLRVRLSTPGTAHGILPGTSLRAGPTRPPRSTAGGIPAAAGAPGGGLHAAAKYQPHPYNRSCPPQDGVSLTRHVAAYGRQRGRPTADAAYGRHRKNTPAKSPSLSRYRGKLRPTTAHATGLRPLRPTADNATSLRSLRPTAATQTHHATERSQKKLQ